MVSNTHQNLSVVRADSHWAIAFSAMAGPCEVLVRCSDASEVRRLASLAYDETIRIEQKFSRYRDDNIVYAINHADGRPISLDEESAHLLQYAGQCFEISDGLFDITSGILRKAWTFNGGEINPDRKLIDSLLKLVGWGKVTIDENAVTFLPGMEIDFGGLGKEYAVDRVAQMLFQISHKPLMVNFGGDIRAMGPDPNDTPWKIGIENPEPEIGPVGVFELSQGAVATSGISHRHCFVNGVRLGHILDPRTGWPVANPPRSVTVLADYCLEAGLLTTLAMLQGRDAELFLDAQNVVYHCIR
jgi:thiamine biosynthesis lipoprotein